MRTRRAVQRICGLGVAIVALALPPAALGADAAGPTFADVQPLLARYCHQCHGKAKALEGEVNLLRFQKESQALAERPLWKKAYDVLNAHAMPPEEAPQPTVAERQRLLDWMADVLSRPEANGQRDPGRLVLRRLNRAEYNNTIVDLFFIHQVPSYFKPEEGMPEVIRIIPFRSIRDMVVDLPPDDVENGYNNLGEVLTLSPLLLEKYLSATNQVMDLIYKEGKPRSRALSLRERKPDREGARSLLTQLASRAFRRPVEKDEVERMLKLFDQAQADGATFDDSFKVCVQAMLMSPHFLFRIEGLSDPGDKQVVAVTDYELASRLSYFLWSSMPDDTLLALAAGGKLSDPTIFEEQVRRMLKSPKAKSLSENFGLQWLQLGKLETAQPDEQLFPKYYKSYYLPQAMRLEALLFFESVMVDDASIWRFVDSDYTYLNASLAEFYGIPVQGKPQDERMNWRRYTLPDKKRGGVLTMAAVLTATSNATRTSPVRRGKWVLETLLGAPPPPPLPDVADLDAPKADTDGLSLRKKLELHRSDAKCASCHQRMDPIGLGLEQYDAIGAFREKEAGKPIDPTATLADGTKFQGAEAFKQLLLTTRRDDFTRSLSEHLLTYAMGRKLDYYDVSTIRQIQRDTEAGQFKFSALVLAVARSYPFQQRRTQGAKP